MHGHPFVEGRWIMHVLIVEDDESLARGIQGALERWSHTSDWARDGADALVAARTGAYDVALVDLGLPRLGGLELIRSLRRRRLALPIIIVTARDAIADRVDGLDAGADDYIVKPFHLDELAARLRAVHRRAQGNARNLVEAGALVLDTDSGEARWHGRPLPLSRTEFLLLRALAERAGRVVARDVLEQAMYGNDRVESNALEVHVHALRRKTSARAIRTVRGLGYLFAGTDEPA
jgi:DNA-binding response OmpR family regulator